MCAIRLESIFMCPHKTTHFLSPLNFRRNRNAQVSVGQQFVDVEIKYFTSLFHRRFALFACFRLYLSCISHGAQGVASFAYLSFGNSMLYAMSWNYAKHQFPLNDICIFLMKRITRALARVNLRESAARFSCDASILYVNARAWKYVSEAEKRKSHEIQWK